MLQFGKPSLNLRRNLHDVLLDKLSSARHRKKHCSMLKHTLKPDLNFPDRRQIKGAERLV